MSKSDPASPLAGVMLVERCCTGPDDPRRIAVAFGGMLAVRFGATVWTEPTAGRDCGVPTLGSARAEFLGSGKLSGESAIGPLEGAYLLTDDEALAAGWATHRKLLVRNAFGVDNLRPQSELTLQAASGLLDIVADPGKHPLAWPGHQVAYATGLVVFYALEAMVLGERRLGLTESAEVATCEVVNWLDWKNRLTEVSNGRETGVERQEEWKVIPCVDGYVAPIFLDKHLPALAQLTRNDRLTHPDFSTLAKRAARLDDLHTIFTQAFAGRTREEIMVEATALGLPFSSVLTPAELLRDPQFRARGFTDSKAGGVRLPLEWKSREIDSAGQQGGQDIAA